MPRRGQFSGAADSGKIVPILVVFLRYFAVFLRYFAVHEPRAFG